MTTQANSTNFLALFTKSSKELISEKFYDAMNSESSDLSKYHQQCKKIEGITYDEHMIKMCEKYMRYLENCDVLNKGNFEYDVSMLLNYWVYENLTNIYGSNNDLQINLAFAKLQYIWRYQNYYPQIESYYQKCKPEISMVNHYDWKERKELYDYYVDYQTLRGTATNISQKCEEYYKKIEKKIPLYKYFEKECLPPKSNCPEIYEKCKPYNPESFISTLPCHNQIAQETAAAQKTKVDRALQQPPPEQPRSVSNFHGTASTLETSEIGAKVGHSVLGVAPVLLTATALYRYTHLGPWIRKLSGSSPNSISDMEKFSTYTQESGDIFSDSAENYISYQPI
ncbi:PIR Superfamily Protein [Plasmodium ovale curtisi]|uniref:PIR Superfamily Protein n=1 Tax=Plasmodium ovale curtisi TaxID=864141 RepID=A0A1A8XDH3_PLAOA|nr:PIR Superfamily Protein [Plasmodium ovale curtisi]SBT02371.1 PIR Superfamily Protein [Plasmodium ovale curtisi]